MIRYETRALHAGRACRVYEQIIAPSYCGGMPRPMWTFFRTKTSSLAATHAILAYTGRGELIGLLVFDRRQRASRGTYVAAQFRGRGIATKMWLRAMKLVPNRRLTIETVSRAGSALTRSLARRAPVVERRLWA